MRRYALLLSGAVLAAGFSSGQPKEQFTVSDNPACDKVAVTLKATTGNCFIKSNPKPELLKIYSNQDLESYSHKFSQQVWGRTCLVNLSLDPERYDGISRRMSQKVLGGDPVPSERMWKVYLSDTKPYNLDLSYGLGNADVDLSGLSIKNIAIQTASADIVVGYRSGVPNKVTMDTFMVKVDLGSVTINEMNLTKSKLVLAEVGFGNLAMDFSDALLTPNRVKAMVGAGNMEITLPPADVPVLIKVSDSWLCSVSLSKGLKKVGPNTFANASGKENYKNGILFNLDVSMGNIVFRERP
jgi:hypothetical protein